MPEHIVDGNFEYAIDVNTADIDGDGDVDILGAAINANEIAWWESDGTPTDGGWGSEVWGRVLCVIPGISGRSLMLCEQPDD